MPVQRGLAQECQEHFQTKNLYEIFSLTRSATDLQSQLIRLNKIKFISLIHY